VLFHILFFVDSYQGLYKLLHALDTWIQLSLLNKEIISHPDAGETTLMEKFLLFDGAMQPLLPFSNAYPS
jgi:hypothetical protein